MEQEDREKSPPSNALGGWWAPIELGRRRRRTFGRSSSSSWEVVVEDEVLERNADSMASISWSC